MKEINVKSKYLLWIILGIVLVVGSFLAFFLVSNYDARFWTSYIFTVIAVCGTFLSAIRYINDCFRNITSNFGVVSVTIIYLILEVIATLLIGIILPVPFEIYLTIQVILLAVFAILYIVMVIGRRNIININDESRNKVIERNLVANDALQLLEKLENFSENVKCELLPLINNLVESIKLSDPMISIEDKHLDQEISEMIAELTIDLENMDKEEINVVDIKKRIQIIILKVKHRNEIVKIHK